jgi:hypothetical protein
MKIRFSCSSATGMALPTRAECCSGNEAPLYPWCKLRESNTVLTNVQGRLFLSLNSGQSSCLQSAGISKAKGANGKLVLVCMTNSLEIVGASCGCLPISLEHIYRFHEMLSSKLLSNPASNIVLCTGPSPTTQFGTLFLLGSFLIVTGLPLRDTISSLLDFEYVISTFTCHGLSAFDFWRALHRSKRMGWIDFASDTPASSDPSFMDIEEYLHYSRCPAAHFQPTLHPP